MHGNDLVVATQGRSFWILDDLSPLREYSEEMRSKNVHMFDVEDSHKVLRSAMRRQGPMGKNPYYGTEVKFFLRDIDEEDSTVLKVEFMSEDMNVLRSYSSDNELKQNKIDLKEGFHTLRWGGGVEGFELPKGVMPPRGSQGFIESFSVVPGKYNAKLSYGDYEKISSFEILPDPRNEIDESHFTRKSVLMKDIHDDINDIYSSLKKMQSARDQLDDLESRLSDEKFSKISELSKSTVKLIDDTELKLISPKQKTFQDVINFRNQLDAQVLDLLSKVDGNVPPITSGELTRYKDLKSEWLKIKTGYNQVVSNIQDINKMLIESSVPFISRGGE